MKPRTIFINVMCGLGYCLISSSLMAESMQPLIENTSTSEQSHIVRLNYFDRIIINYQLDLNTSQRLDSLILSSKSQDSQPEDNSKLNFQAEHHSASIIKDDELNSSQQKPKRSQSDFSDELSERFPEWGMGSVMSQSGDFSSDSAFKASNSMTGIASAVPETQPQTNITTKKRPVIAYGYTSYVQDAMRNKMRYVPFYYTYRLPSDPRFQIAVKLPMYKAENETTHTSMAGVNVAVRFPVLPQWAMSVATNYTYSNAQEYQQTSKMRSFVFTSNYMIKAEKFDIFIGNTIGYYDVYKISYDNESYNPNIRNTVFRNGIMMSVPNLKIFGAELTTEVSFINTRIKGDSLNNVLTRFQNEVGVTIGQKRTNVFSSVEYSRIGLSYMKGENTRGVRLNWGYWF